MSTETVERTDRREHTGSALDVARFEGERRLRVTGVIVVLVALFGALFVALSPDVTTAADIDQLTEAMPPAFRELFGIETLGSLEGLLAGEFYVFSWVVGLAGYLAYSAAGSVAGDLRADRMDTLLAAPVSRTNVLLGKFLALLVPIVVVNVAIPLVLYAGSVLIDDPLSLTDLAALHALAIPYLLCWAAVGLLAGVVVRRGRTASRVALGLVVAAWLSESLVASTDYDWVGTLSPMRYFDPAAVLLDGTYDLAGAALLCGVAAAALVAARTAFVRSDL
ncbi:ABC transporter permease [Halomarina rubra]|uniref:ABC transporter permease n=1 Tax=Halomarina rubra TaxID=2071873 RepID=A0ABD6ATP3_9EURY|nr:ABC transporter permease subunit [Halomarina rubra]